MDDKIVRFPVDRRGLLAKAGWAMSATLESELDPHNPNTDSLRGLLLERISLIEQFSESAGAVRMIEREIAVRLTKIASVDIRQDSSASNERPKGT